MSEKFFQIQEIEELIREKKYSESKKILKSINGKKSILKNVIELEISVNEGMSDRKISKMRVNEILKIKKRLDESLKLKNNYELRCDVNNLIGDYYYNFNRFGKSFFHYREALIAKEGDVHAKVGISNSLQQLGFVKESLDIMRNHAHHIIENFRIQFLQENNKLKKNELTWEEITNDENLKLLPEHFLYSLAILLLNYDMEKSKKIFSLINNQADKIQNNFKSNQTKIIISTDKMIENNIDYDLFYTRQISLQINHKKIFAQYIIPKKNDLNLSIISKFYLNILDKEKTGNEKTLEELDIRIINKTQYEIDSELLLDNWFIFTENYFGLIQKEFSKIQSHVEKADRVYLLKAYQKGGMIFHGINNNLIEISDLISHNFTIKNFEKIVSEFIDYSEIFKHSEYDREKKFSELEILNNFVSENKGKFLDLINNVLESKFSGDEGNIFRSNPKVKNNVKKLREVEREIQN